MLYKLHLRGVCMIKHLMLFIPETVGGQNLVRNKNMEEFQSCCLPPAFLHISSHKVPRDDLGLGR